MSIKVLSSITLLGAVSLGGFVLTGGLGRGPAASAASAPPVRFAPVSRLKDEALPPYTFPKGLQVTGTVRDSRGQPVSNGFVSFTLPLLGWCGNEPRRLGRTRFSDGRFSMSLPGAQEFLVVAEDGRATRVLVDKGITPEVTVSVVLPDHPVAPRGEGDALPWALPERPPFSVALFAVPESSSHRSPRQVDPELVKMLEQQLREKGFALQTDTATPERIQSLIDCRDGRDESCFQKALHGVTAKEAIILQPGYHPDLGYITYSVVEAPTGDRHERGEFHMLEPLEPQGSRFTRRLAESRLRGGRWGIVRKGPPTNACEYLAGARFESIKAENGSYHAVEFPAQSPFSIQLRGSPNRDSSSLDCEGWKFVSRQPFSKELTPQGMVDPLTGRLVLDGQEYLRAGVVRSESE
ncbi:carboxypeptidase regulatory-like domain-containing protein [Corallococcus exiguus]|uniref:carboxypeptidase regulatory-like domain-containing protein n=1 Tax=Corallococcus exiguus TaxID=83462 RepID=UPI001472290E|nr:carboxypeptidase regulatory-like domain-containing protein [Corallococcus exiguus]NNB84132.1 carboxypeptidase regulatory-like domain-containing protein [Corallococcus exiguus]NNB96114.1 carboxypeptidase regulatory-like domain-containing protein [Corallococcus exiguus]